jgi:hypothetical protein
MDMNKSKRIQQAMLLRAITIPERMQENYFSGGGVLRYLSTLADEADAGKPLLPENDMPSPEQAKCLRNTPFMTAIRKMWSPDEVLQCFRNTADRIEAGEYLIPTDKAGR